MAEKLAAAEAQMAERDELEGAIEGKMLALFSRLKQLEDANLQLTTQNEELNARIEGGGSPVAAANGGGGAFLTQPAAASPLKGPHASAPPSASEVIAFINKKTPKEGS